MQATGYIAKYDLMSKLKLMADIACFDQNKFCFLQIPSDGKTAPWHLSTFTANKTIKQ